MTAAPFLKWTGGKGQLLPELLPRVSARLQPGARYHEPFIGGGALFFALGHGASTLSDCNPELINAYEMVRDHVGDLIAELQKQDHSEEHFYGLRALRPSALNPVERAMRFIYLNKTCFNGLHRVNRAGQFNVSWGKYKNPTICNEPVLRAASAALQGVQLRCAPFEVSVLAVAPGDFVYFDPPYVPVTETASFTGYTAGGFGGRKQHELAQAFKALDRLGAHLLLSNSDTPSVRELYSGFKIETVSARRAINSDGDKRGSVNEVLVSNEAAR